MKSQWSLRSGKREKTSEEKLKKLKKKKNKTTGDVWNYLCENNSVLKDGEWFDEVKKYEAEVLKKRG